MLSNKTGNKLCFYQTAADNEGHNCRLRLQFITVALRHREQPVSNVECNFLAAERWSFKSILKTLVRSLFISHGASLSVMLFHLSICSAAPVFHLRVVILVMSQSLAKMLLSYLRKAPGGEMYNLIL